MYVDRNKIISLLNKLNVVNFLVIFIMHYLKSYILK